MRPFDHEADPEDRRCRSRYKLFRPYAFYTVVAGMYRYFGVHVGRLVRLWRRRSEQW